MQLFYRGDCLLTPEVAYKQLMDAADWKRLKRLLGDFRRESGQSPAALARRIKIAKSTPYRIEDVDDPKWSRIKPDLATIDAWVRACGKDVSEFFLRLEGKPAQTAEALAQLQYPERNTDLKETAAEGDNAPPSQNKTEVEAPAHGSSVPASSPIVIDEQRILFDGLTEAIDRFAVALSSVATQLQQNTGPRVRKTGTRPRSGPRGR
jgi:hypothetical protein